MVNVKKIFKRGVLADFKHKLSEEKSGATVEKREENASAQQEVKSLAEKRGVSVLIDVNRDI